MDKLPATVDGNYLAVIEASASSRSKFKFETNLDAFVLHGVLPTGTSFPYAFGFVPSTLGEDGDPLDIVVLTDEPPPVGTVVPCRIVAVLQAEQKEDGKRERNDRLLGVAVASERFRRCDGRKDVDAKILERIGRFFEFYHAEQGKKFEAIGWKGRKTALAALRRGCSAFAKRG
jgi:inorganic pyrophosphatase